MTVEVFSRAVHDEVGAVFERSLVIGRQEGVVDGVGDSGCSGNFRHPGQIRVLERGVGRSLRENQPGVVFDGCRYGIGVGAIYESDLDAEPRVHLGGEAIGSAVGDIADNDVVAGIEHGHKHRVGGRHTGGER